MTTERTLFTLSSSCVLVPRTSYLEPHRTILPTSPHNQFACFAVTAPGLESIAAEELKPQGVRVTVETGGVSWTGDMESIARANLWTRTASRIIVRMAEFRARTFFELERHARKIPWERVLQPGQPVTMRVTCKKSKLYHTDAVAQRLAESIERRLGAESRLNASEGTVDDEPERDTPAEQHFVVRVFKDQCTVSADTSGALLHLRGYRQALAKAPLRETLASGLLIASGWNGQTHLTDPMCGSGTIPIEGAMMARRMAPGLKRRFAFLEWPALSPWMWPRLVAEAEALQLARCPVRITASDRDQGAIAAARANAERAGVVEDVEFAVRPVSALSQSGGVRGDVARGWIATNPPYGVRIGEVDRLRNLYADLGNAVRRARPGWTLALYSAEPRLDAQIGIPLEERLSTRNGGIPIRLLVGTVPTDVPAR